MIGVRTNLAVLMVGLCLIAGSAVYVVFFRGSSSAHIVAELNTDGNHVLEDLARTFSMTGRQASSLPPFVPQPACGPSARRVFARDMEYWKEVGDYDLVSRTIYVLSQRGYQGKITGVMHSGGGTFGTADKGSSHFEIASSYGGDNLTRYELFGYLNCH